MAVGRRGNRGKEKYKQFVWTSIWRKEQIKVKRNEQGNLHSVKRKYTLVE